MGSGFRVTALRVAAIVGWVVMVFALTPWGYEIDRDWGRLAVGVAACSTLALIMRRHALSVTEVYEAGKVAGRREVESDEPRRLRVVKHG